MTEKPNMVELIPARKLSTAEVVHFTVSQRDSNFTKLRDAAHPGRRVSEYVPPGRYARLNVLGELMMTDTLMEWETSYPFIEAARGNVLVAGLGLGMALVPVLQKQEVTSVTVVEKNQDVIDLVEKHLPNQDKLQALRADIFEWTPPAKVKFDTIYFDIWPFINQDNQNEIKKLKKRFKSRLARGGTMLAWLEDT
jgi:spermidine synthase